MGLQACAAWLGVSGGWIYVGRIRKVLKASQSSVPHVHRAEKGGNSHPNLPNAGNGGADCQEKCQKTSRKDKEKVASHATRSLAKAASISRNWSRNLRHYSDLKSK